MIGIARLWRWLCTELEDAEMGEWVDGDDEREEEDIAWVASRRATD